MFALQNSGLNFIAQNFSQQPGQPLLPHSTSGPAAAWRSDGGISVMAVAEGQYLYHAEFDIKSETWSLWIAVAGFRPVVNLPPAMVSRANDRIDVFTLGRDSKLNTDRAMLWTFGTHWVPKGGVPANGIWQPPPLQPPPLQGEFISLGGIFPDEPAGPAVASWSSERLDVFAVGTTGAMFHKWAEGPNIADATDWHPAYPVWDDLGGQFASGPAVVSRSANYLDIFALRASDHQMMHRSWDPMHGWNATWQPVGDRIFVSAPAAVASSKERLDVFALGTDKRMYQNSSTDGGTTWLHTWVQLENQMFNLDI